MPRIRSYQLGPGPRGEETLFSDMHKERLLRAFEDDPRLGESLKFTLNAVMQQLRGHTDSLALIGMEEKEFDSIHGMGPERGKAIMERGWHTERGGQIAIHLTQEKLNL